MMMFLLLGGVVDVLPNVNMVSTVEAATKTKLSKSKASMYVGNTLQLKLKGANCKKVKWSTSNKSIAKVSKSGKITALKKGNVTIAAKYKNKTYKCKIAVKSAKISEKKLVLRVGQGYDLNVNKTSGKVKWTSKNTQIAKVNANGYINPKKIGSTTISAKVGNETYKCTLKVVARFTEDDFVFDEPTDEGYTNYVDYSTGEGSSWYWYFNDATATYKCNRKVNVGDTYSKFTSAYGYCEQTTVSSYDRYREHFNNSAYPRTKVTLTYKDNFTQKYYYKDFYFDKDGTLVLVIWHR